MLLDILEKEIKEAIEAYKKICEDPVNIAAIDKKYIGEVKKSEFISKFIRANTKNRQKKAQLEQENYEKIKEQFAFYIGYILFEKLNLSIDIPEQAKTLVGKLIIDHYN